MISQFILLGLYLFSCQHRWEMSVDTLLGCAYQLYSKQLINHANACVFSKNMGLLENMVITSKTHCLNFVYHHVYSFAEAAT